MSCNYGIKIPFEVYCVPTNRLNNAMMESYFLLKILASTLLIISFTNSLLITVVPKRPSHRPEFSAFYEYRTNNSLLFQIIIES